ncbi:Citrate transporter [Ruminococcaceae bacterium BL-6]|nr:Citrate transporter [Ruminococcaceae bacterium BL-6]
MYLALLGYLMIITFMVLIMTKKLSALTALIVVPIAFGLIAGGGWNVAKYALDGIKGVATTFSMMVFAILYFGIMLNAGLFDPLVRKVLKIVKGDPLKVLVGTAILAAVVSLDGDGSTTVIICCSTLIPLYDRLKIKKIYLATLIILQNGVMNLIPWGGPTARVMSVMKLEAGEIFAPLIPGMIVAAVYGVGVAYYLGLKERKRLGIVELESSEVGGSVELSEEETRLKRPKMVVPNLILTIAVIVILVMGLASSSVIFGVATAIALLLNYPAMKDQRKVIELNASATLNVVLMVIGAGVLMGVLDGAGMSEAIAQSLIAVVPPSMGKYFALIIAFISAPGTFLLNNDAFYFGVLPALAKTAASYGFTPLQIGFAALMGQAFHFLSPLVAFIYLLLEMTKIDLREYQAYISRWTVGNFIIFMAMGIVTGALPIVA